MRDKVLSLPMEKFEALPVNEEIVHVPKIVSQDPPLLQAIEVSQFFEKVEDVLPMAVGEELHAAVRRVRFADTTDVICFPFAGASLKKLPKKRVEDALPEEVHVPLPPPGPRDAAARGAPPAPEVAASSPSHHVLNDTHSCWMATYFSKLGHSEMRSLPLGDVFRAFSECFGEIGTAAKGETLKLIRSAAEERQRLLDALLDPRLPELPEHVHDDFAETQFEGSDDDYSSFPDFHYDDGPC